MGLENKNSECSSFKILYLPQKQDDHWVFIAELRLRSHIFCYIKAVSTSRAKNGHHDEILRKRQYFK